MKHYSAELLSTNDVVATGNLEILGSRTRTTTAITAGTADNFVGLVLSGNTHTFIMDAQGSQFDPKLDSNDVLNFVKNVELDQDSTSEAITLKLFYNDDDGATATITEYDGSSSSNGVSTSLQDLQLSVRGGEVDGTDLKLYSTTGTAGDAFYEDTFANGTELASIDVSSLFGGGGTGAATNPTNFDLPIKTVQGTVAVFEDSLITETAGGAGGVDFLNLMGYSAGTGNSTKTVFAFTGGPDSSGFALNDEVVIQQVHSTGSSAGQAFEASGTVTTAGQAAGTVEVTISSAVADFLDTDTFSVTRHQVSTDVQVGGGLIVTGDLTVSGTTTTVNTATVTIEDKYLAVNQATDGTTTTVDGGLLVLKATETTAQANGAVSAGTGGTHAGIRFNEGTNSGVWEYSIGVPSSGGADTNWTPFAAGSVNVYAATIDFGANATTVTINATGTGGHNLPGNDFTVQLYEFVDGSGVRVDAGTNTANAKRQILPDYVEIATNGNVTIAMPAEAGTQSFRVVIKG